MRKLVGGLLMMAGGLTLLAVGLWVSMDGFRKMVGLPADWSLWTVASIVGFTGVLLALVGRLLAGPPPRRPDNNRNLHRDRENQ